ncbi:hypothetical protein CY34DRAFT_620534 [Suillus luteus UH-Slu-Lm8-n1]|uniref:Uncharacterized protein n=1 Tax=Suillus luteus UH-Slu-Lm8-n1 TaxID=930992 RepID=A0A0D0B3N4_9AGAM|nr:hypothetical protein CY34DRAFT_620534 [Suillus luteus UH-Slu-Lm8-n1]
MFFVLSASRCTYLFSNSQPSQEVQHSLGQFCHLTRPISLSMMTGDRVAHPLLISLANIQCLHDLNRHLTPSFSLPSSLCRSSFTKKNVCEAYSPRIA